MGLKQTRYFTQGCDNLVMVTESLSHWP